MPDPIITNVDTASVELRNGEFRDGVLTSPGASVLVKAGTILATTTAAPAGNWVAWANGAADGTEIARAVLAYDLTTPAAGNPPIRALVGGTVNKSRLIEHSTGTAANVDEENVRQLQDQGITALDVQQLAQLDNA